uniref:Uncharacterized protein n=1 Tax=Scinaia undulata TaxID=1884664 RepID=A0A1G4NXJ5_9FLOR|nr:Hypothetical protein ycf41 [Scinaia undulata]SCW23377.1 Hypothetical protein ycf41 [Scinaia undulata]
MNHCIITAQIVTWPHVQVSNWNKEVATFFIRIANPKRGKPYSYIRVKARNKTGKNSLSMYYKGDYLVFEGSVAIHKLKPSIVLNLIKEHPIVLEF